jgi:hypothetical protein
MDIRTLRKEGHSIKAIVRLSGFSRNTVRRVLREAGFVGFNDARSPARAVPPSSPSARTVTASAQADRSS